MAEQAALLLATIFEMDSSSSDEDSDEEFNTCYAVPAQTLAIQRENKSRIENYVEEVIPMYTLDDFKRFFRLSRNTSETICQQMGTFEDFTCRPGGRPPIDLRKQFLVFLWYVGCQETLCRTADRFNITEFSVLRIRKRICSIIVRHFMPKYIVWPEDQDRQTVIQKFQEKRGFPDVVGAVDSSHVQIRPPPQHPQTYVNRKGYHSIVLQAVCRKDLRYTNCFVGWPGSCNDSRVMKNQTFGKMDYCYAVIVMLLAMVDFPCDVGYRHHIETMDISLISSAITIFACLPLGKL